MHWMVYSWITSFSCTIVVTLVCLFLFRQYRERYLGIWTTAWAAYSLRFIFELLRTSDSSGAFLLLSQAFLLLSGVLIAWGTYTFLARPLPRFWIWGALAVETWTIGALIAGFPFPEIVTPTFVFQAAVTVWTGSVFLREKSFGSVGRHMGWSLILAGLHGLDYPFLSNNERLAPWGFLLANLLTFSVAVGFLLVFSQRVRGALQESERRYQAIFENFAFGVFESTPEGNITHVNPTFAQIFGFDSPEEAMQSDMCRSIHADPERNADIVREVTEYPGMRTFESNCRRKDGGVFTGILRVQSIRGETGVVQGISGFIEDIAEQKRMEDELRTAERRFRDMLDTVRLLAVTLDCQGRVTYCNPHLLEVTGRSREETLGGDSLALLIPPESQVELRALFLQAIRGNAFPTHYQSEIMTRGGERRVVAWNNTVFRDADDRIIGIASLGTDITEQKRMEGDLRESEERYRTLFETMVPGVILQDARGKVTSANPAAERILGMSFEQMRKCDPFAVFRDAIREDGTPFPTETQAPVVAFRTGEPVRDSVIGISIPGEDSPRWILVNAVPKHADGSSACIFATFEDITERKRLGAQLIQAQKLETVGRLTGGIAHDFNNLLTVINGNAEMALMLLSPDDPVRESVLDIEVAAERAAVLTRRLLSFSRRIDAEPQLVNVNTLLLDINRMLRRLIRENIELVFLPGEEVWTVRSDPAQLEQILVNLIVNSRDAMPKGGKITVETANVVLDEHFVRKNPGATDGEFVLLSVRDGGTGMDAETLARIFEPFFTTKDVSGGSGLGLATCLSIVKQYGGYIRAESESGRGTVMEVYFPKASEPVIPAIPPERNDERLTGSETVLVVEDESAVRSVAVRTLAERGYKVLEADHGEDAIRLAEKMNGDTVHLLLTDVVMPRMGGKELAEKLREWQPGIKVMFMSGYIPDPTTEKGILENGDTFIQKPFSPIGLLQNLRRVLDGK